MSLKRPASPLQTLFISETPSPAYKIELASYRYRHCISSSPSDGCDASALNTVQWLYPLKAQAKIPSLDFMLMAPAANFSVLIEFEATKRLLHRDVHGHDASRGFLTPPLLVLLQSTDEVVALAGSASELLDLPLPDFSMPFNVMTLCSSAMAFFAGSLLSLLLKHASSSP